MEQLLKNIQSSYSYRTYKNKNIIFYEYFYNDSINKLNQLKLFIEATILFQKKLFETALFNLFKALSLSHENFKINNFKYYEYSEFEIKILMNIGLCYYNLLENNLYLEIMNFCYKYCSIEYNIFPVICHNLANAYKRENNYTTSLDYINLAINKSISCRNFNNIDLFFYGKGSAEFELENYSYFESFNKALLYSKMLGNLKRHNQIKNNLYKFFDLNFDEVNFNS